MLLSLHSAFMIRVVKLLLKGEVGVCAFKNSHGNYIVDHGKSWKNHGIVFLTFCGNPYSHFHCLFEQSIDDITLQECFCFIDFF